MLGSLVDGGRLSGRGKASPAQGSATEHLSLKTRQKPTPDVLDVPDPHVVPASGWGSQTMDINRIRCSCVLSGIGWNTGVQEIGERARLSKHHRARDHLILGHDFHNNHSIMWHIVWYFSACYICQVSSLNHEAIATHVYSSRVYGQRSSIPLLAPSPRFFKSPSPFPPIPGPPILEILQEAPFSVAKHT